MSSTDNYYAGPVAMNEEVHSDEDLDPESTKQAFRRVADIIWNLTEVEKDYSVILQLKDFSTKLHQLARESNHDVDESEE